MSRAVHGFEGKGLLLNLEREHVLAVVLPVAWGLPQFAVVDVGCHHLLETPLLVLTLLDTEKYFLTFEFVDLPQETQLNDTSTVCLHITITNNCLKEFLSTPKNSPICSTYPQQQHTILKTQTSKECLYQCTFTSLFVYILWQGLEAATRKIL